MLFAALLLALDASPSPSPAPSAQTDCPRDARVLTATVPAYPSGTRYAAITIAVTVGPDGKPQAASVEQSSGQEAIDRIALQAALQSTYLPKLVVTRRQAGYAAASSAPSCRAVTGTYRFRVTFSPY